MTTMVFVDQSTVDLEALHALTRGEVDAVAFNVPLRLHRRGWEQNVEFHHITRDIGVAPQPHAQYQTSNLLVWLGSDKNSGGFPLTVRYGGGNAYLVDATIAEDLAV